ncbi:hypothetical protein L226DRAFT_163486 [Lentinus tigrinus ALCF2SS1-7]|uniref:Uncharacterized protein n=1 Tax=Lentinus tigrinus ALCF2SS1-6 TaxID=1328759 RepID=A0A5C2S4D4_9APHY|nr:hypothetical protein L227DRAFT_223619 [Lentinus tigrinus ALCF2SS1-6]RPD71851.1 hypothetical protein L226DRAFT_163486 [Lentinus tigrinus ALCF2SS1-7]
MSGEDPKAQVPSWDTPTSGMFQSRSMAGALQVARPSTLWARRSTLCARVHRSVMLHVAEFNTCTRTAPPRPSHPVPRPATLPTSYRDTQARYHQYRRPYSPGPSNTTTSSSVHTACRSESLKECWRNSRTSTIDYGDRAIARWCSVYYPMRRGEV